MSYSSSLLKEKITVLTPEANGGATKWYEGSTLHAGVSYTKGARALMQGDPTAYGSILVRLRYTTDITPRCRIMWLGRYYAIDSFNQDFTENTIQITASEVGKMTVEE